ncbi:centriolin isoform X2 [Trichomycterus rosablanca]
MSRKQHELEGRLDDMLTRITKETQEIKDLEQQLTDGQIEVNEALKNDLEGIISGLQEYLHGVKDQARQAQADCLRLQRERDTLQLLLQDKEQQVIQLQEAAQISECAQKEFLQHEEMLQALIRENAELREAQGHVSTYESELEAQLQEKDTEAGQLKEELSRLQRLSQLEHSALQAELQKERQAKENALAQLQLAAERELENNELLQQLNIVQREKGALMEKISDLHNELQQVRRELMCPKQVVSLVEGLRKSIATGSGDLSMFNGTGDLLSESLANLQDELHCSVSAALKDRDEAQRAQDRLTRELGSLKHRLRNYEQKYQSVCEEAKQIRAAERQEEAELIQLREDLHEAHEQEYVMLQRLQEAESERDRLLSELEEQDKQIKTNETLTQDQVQSLDLELQELRRSFTTADRMAVEQLNAAKDKIRSLHSTVQKISQERAENAEELEESRIQAEQAMQDLTRAEAEIQVLQKLLQDRVHVFDEPVDSFDGPHSSILQPELARLNQALKRQQAQTKRLRDQLAQANYDNRGNLEDLLEEIEALRDTLLQQSNYLSSFGQTSHNGGHWYYIPANQNPPSLGSQATQDSGLGSQYVPSPDRGKRFRGRQHKGTKPPSSRGYWVYSPRPHDQHHYIDRDTSYRNSDGESHEDGIRGSCFTPPPGSVIYTVPPDGTPLPPGTVIYAPPVPGLAVHPGAVFYGPPPDGVRLVYGPPPSGLHIPLISNGTLLCNVPGHLDLECSLKDAERCLREQESGKEVVGQELLKLEEQRSELQMQLKELRRAVSRLQHHRRLLESSVSSAEEESVIGEVKCLEKTLLQRRTELRETDRLLLEAEADLKDRRSKTNDIQQRHSEAERRLKDTERDLEEAEWRAQDNAKQRTHAKQQLRDLQEEITDLQRRKQNEELTLQKLEKMIAAREAELEVVSRNLERATNELQNLTKELREKQSQEARLLVSCKDSEETVNQWKKKLEHLNKQILVAKEEQSLLGRKLEQWREEEGVMRASVDRNRFGLVGVLRQGEDEAYGLQQRIKDLHADMQNLAVQKGELDTQLSDRKSRLVKYKKEEQKSKVTVQKLRSVISKHKEDLKHVLDMIQLESGELERVKSQHSQKLDQLEKSNENLLQVRLELQTMQQELEEQRSEQERQRRLQEEEIRTLKEKLDVTTAQRSSLMEQCTNLEARRTHANRCLETAEEGARKAEAEMLKIQGELTKLKQEHRQAQSNQEEIKRDIAATQKQLEEKTEELNKVKENVAHSRRQQEEIRKDAKKSQQELDDFAEQQQEQKAVLLDKTQRRQQRVDKLEQQLKELETAVAWKRTQFEEEEERMKTQQQQSLELEELQIQQQQKLQSQLQVLEEALAQRVEKMDQVSAAVEELEEKRCFMLADQKQCALLQDRVAQLEQHLAESEARLRASTEEQRELRQELDTYRSKIQLLQETLGTERTQTELWGQAEGKAHLREIRDTARSLRPEVQAELDNSMKELKFQSMDYSDTENYEENNSSAPGNDKKWEGELRREKLKQHEDNLKAQLRRTMYSQQEALSLRRKQTEGSIQGLRRRVDQLDQLLGKSDHDPPYLSDSEILTKYSYFETDRWRPHGSEDYSFSPVRLDSSIPEKDQTHLLNQMY